jgi:alpha-D-xyloside xylohydrolase
MDKDMTMDVFEIDGSQIVWRGDGETVVIEPWGGNSLRVRAAVMSDVLDTDFALLPQPPLEVSIDVEDNVARLTNGNITAVMTASSFHADAVGYRVHRCALSFYNQHGTLLFKELDAGGSLNLKARELRPHLGGDFRITAAFESDPAEKLYGMGQYQQHILDIKGSTFELAHRNSQASVPFVMSSAGYGFLWHNPAIGRATFSTNRTEWFAESSKQIDYWVTAGDTPTVISAAYADATGHSPMMPEHGLGFWQCKLRYWNQEQLLEVAREHKRRGLPLDVIVADFFHWPKMGDFRFEEEFWPDPKAMTDELRELGVELMVSVWPQVSTESENFAAMKKNNLLVRSERGIDMQMQFQGPSVFLDPTNPATRQFLWDVCKRNYFDQGIKTFWLDEAEPEYGVYDFDNFRYHLGTNVQVGNIYPQMFARAFYEGQRAAGQEEIVNLLRCAWAGSQRYGALVWSGDIHSTFEDFRRQITAGIHMGVAGIPWFTTDIGGFHNGDVNDPAFRELLVRWFQFGTFCPVMRLHGDRKPSEPVSAQDDSPRLASGAGNELWSFGEDVYEILASYVHLRETMRPYTRELMAQAHTSGQPVMRGMFHEFPAEAECWDLDDQYMYGTDLLVAPVVVAGSTSREVFLPAGASWTNLHTGAILDGGCRVEVDAPLGVIPVFARDGSHPELVGRI